MKAYACKDRKPYASSIKMQDGWTEGGEHRVGHMIDVPFRMHPECQYRHTDLGKVDQRCNGCTHKEVK